MPTRLVGESDRREAVDLIVHHYIGSQRCGILCLTKIAAICTQAIAVPPVTEYGQFVIASSLQWSTSRPGHARVHAVSVDEPRKVRRNPMPLIVNNIVDLGSWRSTSAFGRLPALQNHRIRDTNRDRLAFRVATQLVGIC